MSLLCVCSGIASAAGVASAADLPTTASLAGVSAASQAHTPATPASPLSSHASPTTPSATPTTPSKRQPPQNMPKLRKMSQLTPAAAAATATTPPAVATPAAVVCSNSCGESRPNKPGKEARISSGDGLGCNEEISDNEDENEEEESECSAPFCRQPVAEQICWVQCDHCQEWFHCLCVGLTKEYAEKVDSYNCKSCQAVGVASAGGASQKKGVVVRAERTRVPSRVQEEKGSPGAPRNSAGDTIAAADGRGVVATASTSAPSASVGNVIILNTHLTAQILGGNNAIK